MNKDGDNAKENLKRLGDQIDLLPQYLRFEKLDNEDDGKIIKSRRSATMYSNAINKNNIRTRAKAISKDSAMSIARGLTAPILHFDEPEFTNYIDIIVSNSVSTYETAARNSKKNGTMYCRCFTCTPGDLDSMAGIQAQTILDKTAKWSDRMYDMTKAEMEDYVTYSFGDECNQIVYIEYQYYQIGLDRQWLKTMSAKIGDKLTVRREILLQRLHGSSDSPFDQEDIEYINDNIRPIKKQVYVDDYYRIDMYEELNPEIPYIMSVDCSTGTNGDNNAITFINPYTVKPEAEFECSYIGETKFERLIVHIVEQLCPRAIVAIERNSVGDGIIDHLLESPIAGRLYFDKARDLLEDKMKQNETVESMLKKQAGIKKYYGVYTGTQSREDMIGILMRHMREYKENFVTANITRDISQLVRMSGGKIAAGPGFHDDSVMSYLIGMYVYYYGNNLEMFGFERGALNPEQQNRGFKYYSQEELSDILPEAEAQAITKRQQAEIDTDYESIMRNAILQAQNEAKRIMKSKSVNVNTEYESMTNSLEDDGQIDLDFFDSLNGF
nr:MAG TPA: large terminase [Caudoviricetes sp.]